MRYMIGRNGIIRIEEVDVVAQRLTNAKVPGCPALLVLLAHVADPNVSDALYDTCAVISAAVVDNDDFEVRVRLTERRSDCVRDVRCAVVSRDDERDERHGGPKFNRVTVPTVRSSVCVSVKG